MLTRAQFGLHVTGRVDSVGELTHRQGTAKNGSAYSFWQQNMTLALGGSMVEVAYRADADPGGPLVPFELDDAVRVKVEKPRIFNGVVAFDAVK